jgi:hypothetical protein
LLLFIACASPPEKASGLEEVYEQGLTQYLGTISPSEEIQTESITQYEFAVEDGPMCLYGDSFRAATKPSSSNNLLIYLQGGGACWSELCLAFNTAQSGIPSAGVLNQELDANPLSDWNIGYVPYCDGSLFVGDTQVDLDEDGSIDRYHHGLINLSAALDAIHTDFPSPDRIVMTGMSAGGYGIVLSGVLARKLWPDVPIDMVADGGLGLGRTNDSNFITNILEEWDVVSWIPDSCEDCFARGHATGFASWVLERDSNLNYLMVSSYNDYVISNVFLAIENDEYATCVVEETDRLLLNHPEQTARFLFNGNKHTTLALDSTTDLDASGTLPFDIGTAEQLDVILGRFDVIEVEGITIANWLNHWVEENKNYASITE